MMNLFRYTSRIAGLVLLGIGGCNDSSGDIGHDGSGTGSASTTEVGGTTSSSTGSENPTSGNADGSATSDLTATSDSTTTGPGTTTTTDPGTTTAATTDPGTTTTDPDTTAGPACGDGNIDPDEECDDGAANADDAACTAACKTAVCGDNLVQSGAEACDDGNAVDTDDCSSACEVAVCGDGLVHAGVEQCDDGDLIGTDECTDTCKPAVCGDAIVWEGVETCDDGNAVDTDACAACKTAACGDGFVQAGVEQCDDGNQIDDDSCTTLCKSGLTLRPNVMLCGSATVNVKDFFPGGVKQFVLIKSCVPDANTQAMLVTRFADQASIVQATLQAYLNAGGVVITEHAISDEVFSKAFVAVAQGPLDGTCVDTAPTVFQQTPGDPFWAANGFTMIKSSNTGCGHSVDLYPGITPLAGWTANTVAIAYRQSGMGRLWLADFDWQDGQMFHPMAYTYKLLGYMITHRN